ncbi:hypothetical protein KFE25_011389 [Diacronema lutheri]|uniref:RanBP2-type domain-containing protein n=2 Tax=Diacronema lutheri TaxID=2081491 RepID=A0A8J6C4Y4_DIALT|nr:hypothetical protein KFE25_011389 [Diacronema lutheri]
MPRRSKAAAKAAEERRLDKAELAYADQLPVLWSRFPRIDRDVVRTVWEGAADVDEALGALRQMHASARGSEAASAPRAAATGAWTERLPEWSCARCTLLNEPAARACAACDALPPCARDNCAITDGAPSDEPRVDGARTRRARGGLDGSFMRALPHDALVTIFALLSYDDAVRLGGTCHELRQLAAAMRVRHVRLGARQRDWSDRRVLGLLAHIGELERVSISSALPFHSFGALAALPRASALLSLRVSSPLLTDGCVDGWAAAFCALTELRLPGCALTPLCVPHLVAFGAGPLRSLDVSSNVLLDALAARALLSGLRSLRSLDLSHLPRVDGRLLAHAASAQLRELSLKGFTHAEPAEVCRWGALEALSLQQSALCALRAHLPRLVSLSLAGSVALTQLDIACPALTALDLASCARLEGVRLSGGGGGGGGGGRLRTLNLAMCRRLRGADVERLVLRSAPTLERINLNGLRQMREEPPAAWLRSAVALREHVGRRLLFADLRGSCGAPHPDAVYRAHTHTRP